MDLTEIQDADAILYTWYLGDAMPEAITNLLFGASVPSGRVTLAFPTSVNQIPVYYNYLRTDHRFDPPYISDYIDDNSYLPRYAFGYGLTYSELEYSDTVVDKTTFGVEDVVKASVEITNKGEYDVTEVVQLYMQDCVATVALPIMELKDFRRVEIPAGKTVKVEFEIREEMLRYWNVDMKFESDSGEFGVAIKPNSAFAESDFVKITLQK
jgi:beta-glucosidase